MSLLENKKLKIRSNGPRATVMVFQDGSVDDAEASEGFQFDDAFRSGAGGYWVQPRQLTHSETTGDEFSFTIHGPAAWATIASPGISCRPNDRIEFWADVPSKNSGVQTPAWHLNNQTGQVRMFYGWVDRLESRSREPVTFVCRDALWKANDVKLTRDGAGGLEITKIAFNVEPDSPEFFYSVKKLDNGLNASTGAPSYVHFPGRGTFGVSSPVNMSDRRMTLEEILLYLQAKFAPQLQAAGVISGSTVFDSQDLVGLTMKPGPIILEDASFSSGLTQILQQWAPDMRIRVDPRTLKWRVYRALSGLTKDSTTLTHPSGNVGGRAVFRVANPSLFSSSFGNPGYFAQAVSALDPDKSQIFAVYQVGGDQVIMDGPSGFNFIAGDFLYPGALDIPPTVTIPIDQNVSASGMNLSGDLRDVYTAVLITSTHQETTVDRASWEAGDTSTEQALNKGWDTAYEQFWKSSDEDRRSDFGLTGNGIPIYTVDNLGNGSRTRFTFEHRHSAHQDDHVLSEWVGTSLWLLTMDGQNTRQTNLSYRITEMTTVSDVGNGNSGLRIEVLDTQFLVAYPNFITELNKTGAEVPDKVALTSDFSLPTTQTNNKRWEVGRKWVISTSEVHTQDSSPHQSTCKLPQFTVLDGSGRSRQEVGLSPNLAHPPLNITPYGAFEILATGGIGAHHVWRRAAYTPRVAQGLGYIEGIRACGQVGWRPPQRVEVEVEKTTTTIRQARYPATGFGGEAFTYYGLSRLKCFTAGYWWEDTQNPTYEDLAFRLWNVLSKPHQTGGITCLGVKEFGVWMDGAVRVACSTGMLITGSPSLIQSFWGILHSITLDFENDQVQMSFDTSTGLAASPFSVWEDYRRPVEKKVENLEALVRKTAELPECLAGNIGSATSPFQCDSAISSGGRNAGVRIKTVDKDNWIHGVGPNAASVGNGTTGASTSHGPNATTTAFRDLVGNAFIQTAEGAILPATVSGSSASTQPSGTTQPQGAIAQVMEGVMAALAVSWGLTPQTTPLPIFSATATSAHDAEGRTQFVLRHTGLTPKALSGGEIHVLDYDPGIIRGAYKIVTNTASTVIVNGIAESLPSDGTQVVVYYPSAPKADTSGFPSGGLVVKDANGTLGVLSYSDGSLNAARIGQSGTVIKDSTARLQVKLGPQFGSGDIDTDYPDLSSPALGRGSEFVGFSDPNNRTRTKTVQQALEALFEFAHSAGYVESNLQGKWAFNDRKQSGHLLTL